jgi:beta-glucosidase
VRELKGFKKISLGAGESAEVSFELTRADLRFVGANLEWIAEPGEFDVWIAPSSADGVSQSFELLTAN